MNIGISLEILKNLSRIKELCSIKLALEPLKYFIIYIGWGSWASYELFNGCQEIRETVEYYTFFSLKDKMLKSFRQMISIF